jgi:hypothetical protein
MGTALAVSLGTLAGGAAMQGDAAGGDGPQWVLGYEAALAAAKARGKPVFLVFR